MAIYTDACVAHGWRTFGEPACLDLAVAANLLGQEILMPELAVIEAAATYRRGLQSACDRLISANHGLSRSLGVRPVELEPLPDPDATAAAWRRRLEGFARLLSADPRDALAGLRREIERCPPAAESPKKPDGARDAAIWLGALRDHHARAEVGHFLTSDARGFFDGERLKPRLQEDLAACSQPLHVHNGVPALLDAVGIATRRAEIVREAIDREALAVIRCALRHSGAVPRLVFNPSDEHRFHTVVRDGSMGQPLSTRQISWEDTSVLAIDAEWDLRVDCLFQPLADTQHEWSLLPGMELHGRMQICLPMGENGPAAKLMSAHIAARQEVAFNRRAIRSPRARRLR